MQGYYGKAKENVSLNEKSVKELITCTGENPNRQGLKKTPQRFISAWNYITSGYKKNAKQVVNGALFDAEDSSMVIVKDIDFFSTCEHHLLPFFGKIHVAYIPDEKIIGLSKIPRIVEVFSRRLQVQERMCSQIMSALDEILKPKGVAVVAEGIHTCMVIRGVEKVNSKTVTSSMTGIFLKNQRTRKEFLSLIK
ncbi:MAG: GTP cyclohydrolase I FolE [Candidatus Diapherotrites archaeon]|uniref:GTP cyclohydrolase 1 n=1 Tax=Candidatus Iainarchaeum sp. TaxID=3101447 RepID=A0A7J4IXL8_9ARCH|nr:MAG: GTP cyclohydrolase I [archaeon GW2011_AR10]MBS3058992.1 GTP cyclohydrolase I FolE [Candidatus Diapherotrites archaeon]HIH08995.1 GTP cyclohydrolase I FolE [Candidatus Diapherotrites archaeon]